MTKTTLTNRTKLWRTPAALMLATVLLAGIAATSIAQAQTYSILYTFKGGTDGGRADGSLIVDMGGNLYGSTELGGAHDFGTVFRVDSTGKETVLYSFTGTPDGYYPWSSLVGFAGDLYGTTWKGGAFGYGTIFKVNTKTGTETVLYSFTGAADGGNPFAGLVRNVAGNFYGAAYGGGDLTCDAPQGCGTLFKLDASGTFSVVHTFAGYAGDDGAQPYAGLIQDAAGNLYGTSLEGGYPFNAGTVFKVDTSGNETVLYRFTGGNDGTAPYGGLVRDEAGNLYGTTLYGGNSGTVCQYGNSCGVVFKLDTFANQTVLYSFTGGRDGGNPYGGLARGPKGDFYGTTLLGGDLLCNAPYGCGTVFKVDATGNETVAHRFMGSGGDGSYAYTGLVRDKTGNLYGTAAGGADGFGVVFKLSH